MLRSITMPLHTLSENLYRGMNKFVKHEKTKKQRADVRLLLRQLPTIKAIVGGAPNRFEVVLVRISAGELDDDNLRGALKSVRDEVAAWIGLDDKDPRIAWKYGQQKTSVGTSGVRVDVRDLETGDERIVHLGLATNAGAKAKKGKRGKATSKAPKPAVAPRRARSRTPVLVPRARPQEPIAFVRSVAVLPWKQVGDELALTELPALENVEPAPERTEAREPDGSRITITRRGKFRVEPFGTCWLFVPEGQPFDADDWGLERTGDQ